MSNPVNWFEIYVADMARARKFYQSVLGVELTPLTNPATMENDLEMWSFGGGDMTSYGANGALVKVPMPEMQGGNNSVIIYFHSQDCSIEEKKVTENGGKVIKPKMSIGPYGFISLALDTEKNVIGFHSMK